MAENKNIIGESAAREITDKTGLQPVNGYLIVPRVGLAVRIVPDEEAYALADFIVCCSARRPSEFTDDVIVSCHDCGRSIRLRPHVPERVKRICIDCARDRGRSDSA